ncbi:hypothetical protein HOE67_04995 [Candidatus Peregrinibacteria bacterium]|nr:hypothetical protein [Candidatus Peregrinibacteria bacterium]
MSAKGHTQIYKIHKYFARRPHNVFAALIEQYSDENSLIYDCFGGGGVTLIEGLSKNRRVISSDINPIASFIQYCQVLPVTYERIETFFYEIEKETIQTFGRFLNTECESCGKDAHVRWAIRTYEVTCPYCASSTFLNNSSKDKNGKGKSIAGSYKCNNCNQVFKSVNAKRQGSKILKIRFRCKHCKTHTDKIPSSKDIKASVQFEKNEGNYIRKLGLNIPSDNIPEHWDRQKEDCLNSKGFIKFRQLFTPRNRVISAFLFKALETRRKEMTDDEFNFSLMILSSLLRYTNNMNFSTENWMDGRPVAWSKHAFWTPNEFVESNPLEYLRNRLKAAKSGLKDQKTRFNSKVFSPSPNDVVKKTADYSVYMGDSSKIPLKDNSVDLVLTDPPYGSNVQYGELCYFWYVWLKKYSFFKDTKFDFANEVLVHRKQIAQNSATKTYEDYIAILTKVFKKAYKTLKLNGLLVFTFNNKDERAWHSVVEAAYQVGFTLDRDAVAYQGPINAYRDTSHQRYEGTPQGDYIFSFRKSSTVTLSDTASTKTKKFFKTFKPLSI